jgi:hypothetical protein
MALTVGAYAWPDHARVVAVAAVVAMTAVDYFGVQKSARLTLLIVVVVLAVLALVVAVCLTAPGASADRLTPGADATGWGVLRAAGLLFFAFAGVRADRHAGRGGSRPGAHHSARDPAGAGPHPAGVRCRAGGAGPFEAGRRGRTAGRRGTRGRRGVVGRSGPGRRGGRGARLAAGAVAGRVPHHPGDGTGPAPAARARGGPPEVRRAAPGGVDRRRGGRAPDRDDGPAGRDRLLVVRGATRSPTRPPGR